jgi:hypothetical protein
MDKTNSTGDRVEDQTLIQTTVIDADYSTRRCEFFEDCTLFAHLCKSRDKVYRIAYCEGDFEACERRKLRLDGVHAPDDLMPSGYRMQPDGTAYPSIDPDLKCNTRPVEVALLVYWIIILGFVMASSVLV